MIVTWTSPVAIEIEKSKQILAINSVFPPTVYNYLSLFIEMIKSEIEKLR